MDKNISFFDSYPDFFKTSIVGSTRNRLNNRYGVLIEKNCEIIKNSVILDLASHDGRWSFASLMNGAHKVIGIEGRRELVENAERIMKKYGIPDEKYSFKEGDLFEELGKIDERVDVVFCFGIFYHVMNHMLLLSLLQKLSPHYLILDSAVSDFDSPTIELKLDDVRNPASATKANIREEALVGWPSKKAIEFMLTYSGFDFNYYDWQSFKITNWKDIEDYHEGKRVSLVAKNINCNYK